MITTLIPTQCYDGETIYENRPISIEDGKIISFDTVKGAKEIKLDGLLCSGFIDTQVNGGGGFLLNENISIETLNAMVKAHSQFGTSAMLPTLITSDLTKIEKTADLISKAIKQDMPGVLGVHFEGPHISGPKKGIHNQAQIRPLGQQELDIYCRDDLGIKLLTLAPEHVSPETIKELVSHNVIVCLGHSNADYETTRAALQAGASGFTHLFNAMSAIESRAPNMVGAALLDEDSWCGIILDGHHVHPQVAKIAYRAKASQKMLLVSDAMSTIGSDQLHFHFDGHDISLHKNKLTSKTGQLAGSALSMVEAVENARHMLDIPLNEAINMASLYPASFLGIEQTHGRLGLGTAADFTLLCKEQSPLQVNQTWISGKQIFNRGL
ncbi:N-acetylglucosamine-6-phosphate deacetylase (plasmid) [Alteromonas macleodii]|jgi:N-acetylglucosamine-6-phosphate deacetylase